MQMGVNINGAWKEISKIFANINGAWKEITASVNIGGVWQALKTIIFAYAGYPVKKIAPDGNTEVIDSRTTIPVITRTDPDGNVYVADGTTNNISKYASNGQLVWSITNVASTTDLTLDTAGNLYVFGGSKAAKYRPDGSLVGSFTLIGVRIRVWQDRLILTRYAGEQYCYVYAPSWETNTLGNYLFRKAIQSQNNDGNKLEIDTSGNIYVPRRLADNNSEKVTQDTGANVLFTGYCNGGICCTPNFIYTCRNNYSDTYSCTIFKMNYSLNLISTITYTLASGSNRVYTYDTRVDKYENVYILYMVNNVLRIAKFPPDSNVSIFDISLNAAPEVKYSSFDVAPGHYSIFPTKW